MDTRLALLPLALNEVKVIEVSKVRRLQGRNPSYEGYPGGRDVRPLRAPLQHGVAKVQLQRASPELPPCDVRLLRAPPWHGVAKPRAVQQAAGKASETTTRGSEGFYFSH